MQIPGAPPQPPPPMGVGPPVPLQPIRALQPPQIDPTTVEALLSLQGPKEAATRSALKAAALREKSPTDAAQGAGPQGIRIGEGKGGWAVSLGDMVGAVVNKHVQKQADSDAAVDAGVSESLRKDAYKKYVSAMQANQGVPQGTPMTNTLPTAPQSGGGTGLLSL